CLHVVTDWASPSFLDIGAIIFLILILVVLGTLALSPDRADPADVALVLAFTFLALQAVRNLAMSGIVLGVVAAKYMPGAIETLRGSRRAKRQVGAGSSAAPGFIGLVLAAGGRGLVLAG